MELLKPTYSFSTKTYALDQIINFYKNNKIDTNLDCQRGLVWTDDQKQGLIDTLIRRERVPEFHVIKEDYESIFHFADGKQRITTTIDFLTNKLKWLKSKSSPDIFPLFKNSQWLYFKDLPEDWQNAILNSEFQFACYKDMTPKGITVLFRKLNSGTSLSSFAKGLAANITVKQYFLDPLMAHPVCSKIFSESMINKDDAEQVFIRLFALLSTFDKNEKKHLNIDLRPTALETYYLNIENASNEEAGEWIKKLEKYTKIIRSMLDRLNTFEDNEENPLRTSKSFPLLFAMYYTYMLNLNDNQFDKLYRFLNLSRASDIVGAGADYSASKIKIYINYIDNWVIDNII